MDALERLLHDTLADASRAAPNPLGPPEYRDRGRMRSRLAALTTAAAVLAIALVVTTVGLPGRGSSPTPQTTPPVGPAGQVLVGFDVVAIPLPSGWSLNATNTCGTPEADTVVLLPLQGPTFDCLTITPPVRAIILDGTGGELATRWEPTATEHFRLADGTQALRGRTTAQGAVQSVGDLKEPESVTVVVVPSLHVIAVGLSRTAGALDRSLSQITRMPTSAIAVPMFEGSWSQAAAGLAAAGLNSRERTRPIRNFPSGHVLSTIPAAGTVVAKGSTVIVRVSG